MTEKLQNDKDARIGDLMKKPDDPVLFHAFRKENNKVTGPSD
jgi:hypothetical protein